ncbi:MAG: hypothetical protein IKR89_03945 [Bacteroidaceae bacterium]|nr:hypothetical protein [Bacteroidaceae bacterium]
MDDFNTLTTNNINDSFPFGEEFKSKFEQLANKKKKDDKELVETLKELKKLSPEVNIEKFLWVVKASSIESNIEKLYKTLSHYIIECGKAIKKTNDNQSTILDLIILVVMAEHDLYKHIENQSVSYNKLTEDLSKWLKEQGIYDDRLEILLNFSLQRVERISNESKKMKRFMTWTVIASITLSTALSYIFSHFL